MLPRLINHKLRPVEWFCTLQAPLDMLGACRITTINICHPMGDCGYSLVVGMPLKVSSLGGNEPQSLANHLREAGAMAR
jgi:hypothetical protein